MDYSVDMPDGMFRYGGSGEDAFEKDKLATVLRESVVGMAVVSPHPDGVKLLYTNDAFFNMFGYTREEYETIDIDTRFNLFVMDDFVDIVKRRIERDGALLAIKPGTFRQMMYEYLKEIGIERHTPHDCRHTFSRLCESYGVRENDRKRMLGHKVGDITNDVYGHRTLEELRTEIEKIKKPK